MSQPEWKWRRFGVCTCDSFDTVRGSSAITGGKFPAVMVRAVSAQVYEVVAWTAPYLKVGA